MHKYVPLFEEYTEYITPYKVKTFQFTIFRVVDRKLMEYGFKKKEIETHYTNENTYEYKKDEKILNVTSTYGGKILKIEIPGARKIVWVSKNNHKSTLENVLKTYFK